MECPLCNEEMIDKVLMTCNSQHSFCFKCLLKGVEVNSELKSCPTCRGGIKYVMLSNETNSTDVNDINSLFYFRKSLPILQKVLGEDVVINTCLISEDLLVCYVRNKKQIGIIHKLLPEYKIDELVPLIKWDKKKNLEESGMEFLGHILGTTASDFFQSEREPLERNRRGEGPREQNQQRSGSRFIFGGVPFTGPFAMSPFGGS
jgi:hypothetical protein